MTLLDAIEDNIFSGMASACHDTFFLEGESQRIGAEYLLTVSVAKALIDLSAQTPGPLTVHLERKTKLVATDCVPLMAPTQSRRKLPKKHILRQRHNTKRNGKVDISVYRKTGQLADVPVCVIELKGFDPRRADALKDLRRNTEYFRFSDRTGSSQLQYACFASMHSFPRSVTEHQRDSDLKSLKARYTRWLSQVGLPHGITYRVQARSVTSDVEYSYLDDRYPDDPILERHHHFAGVTISYGRGI